MLLPRKTKFRKQHRGRRRGLAKGQQQVNFGDYGLKSLENGWVTNRQIEAARIAMTRRIKRGGKVADQPLPGQAGDTAGRDSHGLRQGLARALGGRGRPGRVMFELRWASPRPRARGHAPGRDEAAGQDQVRQTRG